MVKVTIQLIEMYKKPDWCSNAQANLRGQTKPGYCGMAAETYQKCTNKDQNDLGVSGDWDNGQGLASLQSVFANC